MPLPLTGQTRQAFPDGVNAVVAGPQEPEFLYATDEKGVAYLFGAGYEFERPCEAVTEGGEAVGWAERVQVVRSFARAASQDESLEERLRRATAEIQDLTRRRAPAGGNSARRRRCGRPWRRFWGVFAWPTIWR